MSVQPGAQTNWVFPIRPGNNLGSEYDTEYSVGKKERERERGGGGGGSSVLTETGRQEGVRRERDR